MTYTVAAPSGKWSADNDGTYTINLLAGQVRDTAGNAAAANTAPFDVNIPIPDTTAPTATISAPPINSPGGTNETISVTYADNRAVDVSTINVNNITVQGPTGPASSNGRSSVRNRQWLASDRGLHRSRPRRNMGSARQRRLYRNGGLERRDRYSR